MEAALIIGDWGTSNARLWLCDRDGMVLDQRHGPGMSALRGDIAAISQAFETMTAGWPDAIPALLAGMVGAGFGWRDAGYFPCPIAVDAIGAAPVRAPTNGRAVWIVPGLRCINAWGEPDTMRGEELQIAGWAALHPGCDAMVAMPGTHCKWARVAGGIVTGFHSAVSGELFAVLREHSVMVDHTAADAPFVPEAFAQGVALARAAPDVDLAALLFSARARQATGMMAAAAAPSYLSGMVIGCDIRTALRLDHGSAIAIIGAPGLTGHYADAIAQWGVEAPCVDGDRAMQHGLLHAARAASLI